VFASEQALADAGLIGTRALAGGRAGVAYGSSFGSHQAVLGFAHVIISGASTKLNGTSYVQMMSHTAAVNIGLFFGITGRIVPTSSACTSGSHGIGYAYEMIRHGLQDIMVAGGAEELSVGDAAAFDTLYATSVRNDAPEATPRPFDRDRDGLVVGEGAATLVLEALEHAHGARRPDPCGDRRLRHQLRRPSHHADRRPRTMQQRRSTPSPLADAGLDAAAIGFVKRPWHVRRIGCDPFSREQGDRRGVSAIACLSIRSRAISDTRFAPAAASKPGSASR